jgi:MFS family permease
VNAAANSAPPAKSWMTRGVLGIGLASLFSDWGHEAATAILPVFLASLGAPAFALGVVEGVSDGFSSVAKLAGGWLADRPRWRKPTCVAGYALTALSTFSYSLAATWPALLLARAVGWIGRGSRSPARDALLADAVHPSHLGRAFGFERAMDTAGAVLGPLCAAVAVGLLGARATLQWTLVPGLLAPLSFLFLVPSAARQPAHHQPLHFLASLRQLSPRFRHFLVGVFVHGIGDFAPTLLILRAAQILTPDHGLARASVVSVALYTFFNCVSAAATYPAGALADRLSKRGLLALGYFLGALMCLGFIFIPATLPVLVVLFALAGLHHAVRDSLEKSLAAELLAVEVRGSGFGVLATVNGIGDLVSSVAVGFLWSAAAPVAGFLYAGFFILAGAFLILSWR